MTNGYPLDLAGQSFGCFTVLRRARRDERPSGKGLKVQWLCRCECGVERFVRSNCLQRLPKSCGINGHRYVPPGLTPAKESCPEYGSWRKMRERCRDPNHDRFKDYGGRGVKVCPQWDDFEVFLRDMGPKPTRDHTIERKDNDGNYEPSNCVWATPREQSRNKTNTLFVEYNGVRMKLADLADELGLSGSRIAGRLRLGWDLDRAIATPIEPRPIYMTKRRRELLAQVRST